MEVFTLKIRFLVGLMVSPLPSAENIMNTHFLQELTPRNGIPDAAPLFYTDSLLGDPLLACLMRCLSYSTCLSVFLSTTGVCRGYPFLHFQNGSIELVFSEGETYFQKDHDCNTAPGYTWSSEYRICFKYHSKKMDHSSSKSLCQEEDPRSHLFLVDSDKSLAFLEHIIDVYHPSALYLQGERADENSIFVDDFGRKMTYFVWYEGEPLHDPAGLYLRTVRTSRALQPKMEVSFGNWKWDFVCFIM